MAKTFCATIYMCGDLLKFREFSLVQSQIKRTIIIEIIVPPWWPGSSSKIIKVNGYVRHNFI